MYPRKMLLKRKARRTEGLEKSELETKEIEFYLQLETAMTYIFYHKTNWLIVYMSLAIIYHNIWGFHEHPCNLSNLVDLKRIIF